MNLSRKNIIILLILIFHFVGMLGLSFSQTKDYFLFLTPFHLLFTSILIFLSRSYSKKFFLSVFLIFIFTFLYLTMRTSEEVFTVDFVYSQQTRKRHIFISISIYIYIYSSFLFVELSELGPSRKNI